MKTENVPDDIQRLRGGKRELREMRRNMTLAEKVEQVVRLQAAVLPMIRRRRPLTPIERVWQLSRKPD